MTVVATSTIVTFVLKRHIAFGNRSECSFNEREVLPYSLPECEALALLIEPDDCEAVAATKRRFRLAFQGSASSVGKLVTEVDSEPLARRG